MVEYLKRSWAEIDLDALAFNCGQVQSALKPGVLLLGVVKADGYGHGAVQVARRLAECGANWLGVSNIEEAVALRRSGLKLPILIFGTTPPELAGTLAQQGITQAVYSLEYAFALQDEAARAGVAVDCHVKLDTGMSRLGFGCDEQTFERSLEEVCTAAALANLHVTGAFTHFASADESGDGVAYTHHQYERFARATGELRARGVALPLRHCSNSAGIISYPEYQLEMVRAGIILYGLMPSDDCLGSMRLRPVMQLKSQIASVKTIPAGTQVSYGRIYTTPRDMEIAVVPIGYADGYQRSLSGRSRMLVHGQYAPVVGRVCMDQLMLDVSEIPGVRRGDPVTVLGEQEGRVLPVEELSGLLGSISYEFTCLLSKRIPRVYLRDGQEVAVANDFI